MKICLIRHGKPRLDSGKSVSAGGFGEWLKEFDATGIDPWAQPPGDVLDMARDCKAAITSPLVRAHESARFLFPDRSIMIEPLLREFGLPRLPLPLLTLTPGRWAALCRALWFLGYCCGTESIWEARARAAKGAEMLVRLAAHNESVAFVGHGMINTFIARELRRQGWTGPLFPGTKYWGAAEYRCGLQPIKGREALVKRARVTAPDPGTV